MDLFGRYLDTWPADEFERLRTQLDDMLSIERPMRTTGLFDRSFAPRLDVVETDNEFVVACDLPGMTADDINLALQNNVLTIQGEKRGGQQDDETARTARSDTWYGTFQRTVALPESADPDHVSAEFRHGVLAIRIGKREEHKPRRIEVSVK